MVRTRALRFLISIVSATILLGGLPARAVPLVTDRDKTDNTYYFDFDAVTGTIQSAESSALFKRRDRVSFYVYIREAKEPQPGARLVGLLQLNLICKFNRDTGKCLWKKTAPVTYDGTFSIRVTDDATGALMYQGSKRAKITLRRAKGERRASLRFPFDLVMSDNYTATADFMQGEPTPAPTPTTTTPPLP